MNGDTVFFIFSTWFLLAVVTTAAVRTIGGYSWDEALIATGKLTLVIVMTATVLIGAYHLIH